MDKDLVIKQQQNRLVDAGDFPKVVLIDTVSYCNLRCSMCVHKDMTRPKGIMSWELFVKIIDEIAQTNKKIRVWMVFFGEALILKKKKPTIFEMIAYAKGKGLTDVVLNSNANILNKEDAKNLIKSGLDAIYIGIDAFKPETYSKLRVGGNYKLVVNNTANLIKLRDLLKANSPKVYAQFVVMDVNKDEQKDFKNFWHKQGAIVKIRPKVSWAGMIPAPNQVFGNKDRWPCHWVMQTLSITDKGKVVLCPCDLDARYIVGDINSKSIKDVWNDKLKKIRKLHEDGKFELLPEICRDCRDWQSARSNYY